MDHDTRKLLSELEDIKRTLRNMEYAIRDIKQVVDHVKTHGGGR